MNQILMSPTPNTAKRLRSTSFSEGGSKSACRVYIIIIAGFEAITAFMQALRITFRSAARSRCPASGQCPNPAHNGRTRGVLSSRSGQISKRGPNRVRVAGQLFIRGKGLFIPCRLAYSQRLLFGPGRQRQSSTASTHLIGQRRPPFGRTRASRVSRHCRLPLARGPIAASPKRGVNPAKAGPCTSQSESNALYLLAVTSSKLLIAASAILSPSSGNICVKVFSKTKKAEHSLAALFVLWINCRRKS